MRHWRESDEAERAVIALSLALGVPMVFPVSLCQIRLPLLKYGRDGHTLIFREAPEREDA